MQWIHAISEENIHKYIAVIGFIFGILLSFYAAYHWYFYLPYSSLCFNGYHWHHLYTGFIITVIMGFWLVFNRQQKKSLNFTLLFLFYFGLGMMVDDLTDHFVFGLDPWIFYC